MEHSWQKLLHHTYTWNNRCAWNEIRDNPSNEPTFISLIPHGSKQKFIKEKTQVVLKWTNGCYARQRRWNCISWCLLWRKILSTTGIQLSYHIKPCKFNFLLQNTMRKNQQNKTTHSLTHCLIIEVQVSKQLEEAHKITNTIPICTLW